MKRERIDSSRIKRSGYDTKSAIFEVEFTNGEIWQYHDVPKNVWEAFIGSESKGSYFHHKIKYRYTGSSQE